MTAAAATAPPELAVRKPAATGYSEARAGDPALVHRAWVSRSPCRQVVTVLPDACVDLVWRHGEDEPRVVGPTLDPFSVTACAGESTLGVRLLPGAFPALTGFSPRELLGASAPVSEFFGWRPAPFAMSTLLGLTAAGPQSDVDPAVAALVHARPGDALAVVARDCGLSERQLRRRVRSATGLSPVQLRAVVRFQRGLALADRGAPWSQVAAACGYADQAHLSREVRRFAGAPPSALHRSPTKGQDPPMGVARPTRAPSPSRT